MDIKETPTEYVYELHNSPAELLDFLAYFHKLVENNNDAEHRDEILTALDDIAVCVRVVDRASQKIEAKSQEVEKMKAQARKARVAMDKTVS